MAAPIPTAPARYGATAITLHWLLALMIAGAFVVGLYMHELATSPLKLRLINWHKWAGVTILALSALRLLWRLAHRPPPALPMPAWQAGAAHATHVALYLLCFVVPLVGWAYSSAAGFPVVWFGVLPLPDIAPVDKALAQAIRPWHERSAWLLALLVLAHVGAALKHHVIDGDGLLDRMRPGRV